MCNRAMGHVLDIDCMEVDDMFTMPNMWGYTTYTTHESEFKVQLNYNQKPASSMHDFQVFYIWQLMSLLGGMKPVEFINRMESEMAKNRGYGVYWRRFKTFPQLVLAFVMQHVHSLRWDDDKDDWVPYNSTRDAPYSDDS